MCDLLLKAVPAKLARAATIGRRRLSSESGFAVPTVMLMTVAALGMAGVAVTASINGQGGTVRDQRTKSALAVAESGVGQALLFFNRHGLVSTNPCAPISFASPDAQGWCPKVTGTTVNGGTVSYRVMPSSSQMPNGETAWTDLEIVSIGTFGEVTRRVDVAASSSSGQDMFVDAAVKSKDGIVIESKAEIHAGTATNGNITLGSNAKQCGVASVGIGKGLTGGGYYSDIGCKSLGGTPLEDEISLPPVNQGTAPEDNDNHRLFSEDKVTGEKNKVCWSGLDGNGKVSETPCGDRELVIGSNTSVTLEGSVYSFCKLTLKSNSSLYVKQGQQVTIYFDSPEACKYPDGVTQLELRSNSRITAAQGKSVNLAMLFVGSPTMATRILMNSETAVDGPCEQNFVVYAPYTDIELDSNTKFCGALAGKTVHLDSEAQVWTNSAIENYVLPNTAPLYVAERFVECTAIAATVLPDEGC